MEKINRYLNQVAEKMTEDWDYLFAITGRRRIGKSTLGYWISEYVSNKLDSKVWLCYDYPELQKAMHESTMNDVIFADESISFLSKMNWNSKEAVEFTKMFDRMAYKNLMYLLIMPAFNYLAKGFRTDRIGAHIFIKKRGLAYFYIPKHTKDGIIPPKNPQMRDSFPRLPPDKEEEYRRIKEDAMELSIKRSKTTKEKSNIQELKQMEREGKKKRNRDMKSQGLTQPERGANLNIKLSTIKYWDVLDNEKEES